MAKIKAVYMDAITKKSGHTCVPNAVSVCTTPAAPSPIPLPYPVTSTVSEGVIDPPMRTKFEGAEIVTVGSCFKACHGNEPGTLKEVVSLNTGGPCFVIMGAPNVFVELGMAGITGSPCMMNKAPTFGAGANASSAGGAGGGGGSAGGGGAGPSGQAGSQSPSGGAGGGGGGGSDGSSASSPSGGDDSTPTPEERALAREPNASPDDGRNGEREAARRKVAEDFYRESYPEMTDDQINSHLNGIDFTQPVEKTSVPPPPELDCHMWPGNNPQPGNYFAPTGTPASQLGINPDAANRDNNGAVEPRPVGTFTPPPEGTPALRSTAAPIEDTWSDPNNPYQADGGGIQYNIPDKGSMQPAS